MEGNSKPQGTLVTGVIGEDVHITGLRILEHAFRNAGFKVVSLGIHNSDNDFINAAIETKADAILISSLAGHAGMLVHDLRSKCVEAGIGNILLYIGGQLVMKKMDWPDIEKMFRDEGFNRVYPPFTSPDLPISDLRADLGIGGK